MGAAPDDPRRDGQQIVLSGLALTWRRYQAYSASWEHEHCCFCSKKFLDPAYSAWTRETLAAAPGQHADAGYTNLHDAETPAGRHWICRECFDDFAAEFRWQIAAGDPGAWPYDTPEPDPRPTEADHPTGSRPGWITGP